MCTHGDQPQIQIDTHPLQKKKKKTTTSGNDKKQTSEFKHVILEHEQEIICIEDEQKQKKV